MWDIREPLSEEEAQEDEYVEAFFFGRSSFEEKKSLQNHVIQGWVDIVEPGITPTRVYAKSEDDDPPYQIAMPADSGGDWVYVIHAPEVRRVKIGYTTDPAQRLATLRTGSPVRLQIVKLIRGDKNEEARLHFRFRDKRLDGEWFDDSILDDWARDQ